MSASSDKYSIISRIEHLLKTHCSHGDGVHTMDPASFAPYMANCLTQRFGPQQDSSMDKFSCAESQFNANFHSDLIELIMRHCQINDRNKAEYLLELMFRLHRGDNIYLAQKAPECETVSTQSSSASSCGDPIAILNANEMKISSIFQMGSLSTALASCNNEIVSEEHASTSFLHNEHQEEGNFLPSHLLDDEEDTAVISVTLATLSKEEEEGVHHQQQEESQIQMQFQIEQTSQLLMSIHVDLSYEAACAASVLAKGDVNLAQHALEQALSAPPVCRHMLHNGCYRSDCHFSHDIESHACSFWISGKCAKAQCRFLHGFSEKLIEGVQSDVQPSRGGDYSVKQTLHLSTSPIMPQFMTSSPAWSPNIGQSTDVPSWSNDFPALGESMICPGSVAASGTRSMSSYAYAAQRRKKNQTAACYLASSSPRPSSSNSNTVKIPKEVWSRNPHHHRNAASCFHIADPILRYTEVTKLSSNREDVMDMHFQSTKTVSVVLSRILPKKLQKFSEVWVVTGTGHHVPNSSHQKSGGVLESAVLSWLNQHGYHYVKGKDHNGHGGAVLVKR